MRSSGDDWYRGWQHVSCLTGLQLPAIRAVDSVRCGGVGVILIICGQLDLRCLKWHGLFAYYKYPTIFHFYFGLLRLCCSLLRLGPTFSMKWKVLLYVYLYRRVVMWVQQLRSFISQLTYVDRPRLRTWIALKRFHNKSYRILVLRSARGLTADVC